MKFILDFFVLITGIGAASGLVYHDDKLFVVSDNGNYLYEYHIDSKALSRHLLLDMDGDNEQVDKRQKLDLEAICLYEDMLFLVPSGSTPDRTIRFEVDPNDLSHIDTKNTSDMYSGICDLLDIPAGDFNIEGMVFHQDTMMLFNRGNGPNEMNGIIKVSDKGEDITFTPIRLPDINGQTAGFTDATLVGDKIYYLAAAEGGKSSYHDGEIGGSQVGIINLGNLHLEQSEILSLEHKFEGITLYRSTAEEYIFLLCDDPDNDANESTIYQLRIQK